MPQIKTQTPDGHLPILNANGSNSSSSSSHPGSGSDFDDEDNVEAAQDVRGGEGGSGSGGRRGGGGLISGIGRRALLLRLPRQRPRPLVTTPTCLGCCHIYRPRTTLAALLMLSIGLLFVALGLSSMFSERVDTGGRGVSLIILGGISMYASYILLGIHLRWDNFDGTMLPSYDEEEGAGEGI